MKLPIAFAFILQLSEATNGGFLSSLFGNSKEQHGHQANAMGGIVNNNNNKGDIFTTIFGGSDRGKQPDILEQIGGMVNGFMTGMAQNRIDLQPLGLNFSIGDMIFPLAGAGGTIGEKSASVVGVPDTDYQHKELIARIRQKVFTNCTLVPLDIVFVVDGSSSIGRLDFQVVKLFVADVTDIFAGAGRFGVVQYSEYARTEFHLAETADMSPKQLRDRVAKISYLTGTTKTNRALKFAYDNEFTAQAGNRSFAPDVVIVITDGRSQDNPEPSAKLLQQKGCTVYAIGITQDIDKNQLLQIAGGNQDRVFIINDFTELNEQLSLKLVQNTVCATQKLTNVTATPYIEPLTSPGNAVTSTTGPPMTQLIVDPVDFSLVSKSTENSTQNEMLDVVFLVDSSGSVGAENFEKVKQFIISMIARLYADKIRFGLTQFSSQTWTECKLQDSVGKSLADLQYLVQNLTYRRGDTYLAAALEQMAKVDFTKEAGDRPEAADILVIITNSKTNDFPKIPAIALLSMGVQIYAVGVTNEIDVEQLKDITGNLYRVYTVEKFEDLNMELSVKITSEAVRQATTSFTIIKTNSTISTLTGIQTGLTSANCTLFGERYADLCTQSHETCANFCNSRYPGGLRTSFCLPHETNVSAQWCFCHYCKELVPDSIFGKVPEQKPTEEPPIESDDCNDVIKMRFSTRLCDDGEWRCKNFCNWKYDSLLVNTFCSPHETNASAQWCCCHYCGDYEIADGVRQRPPKASSTINENGEKSEKIDIQTISRTSDINSTIISQSTESVDQHTIVEGSNHIPPHVAPAPIPAHIITDPAVSGTMDPETVVQPADCGGFPATPKFFGTEPCDNDESGCSQFCQQRFASKLAKADCVNDWLKSNKKRCYCHICVGNVAKPDCNCTNKAIGFFNQIAEKLTGNGVNGLIAKKSENNNMQNDGSLSFSSFFQAQSRKK